MYRIVGKDYKLYPDSIELSDELFPEIRKRFGAGKKERISVLKENEVLFAVEWEEEYFLSHSAQNDFVIPFYCNYEGENLCLEANVLDFLLVDRFKTLWFDEINEYSWQIIQLLSQERSHIKLLTGDERTEIFRNLPVKCAQAPQGEDVARLYGGNSIPDMPGDYSIYSLMISLTWAKKRHYNEKAEHGGTALRIDPALYVDGFGDVFRKLSAYYTLAKIHGWEPVVCLDHGSQYADYKEEDVWSKFFLPVGKLSPGDERNYSCWISVYENRRSDIIGRSNPYLFFYAIQSISCAFEAELTPEAKEAVTQRIPEELFSDSVTDGLIIRGSDYDVFVGEDSHKQQFVEWVEEQQLNCDQYFLATEEQSSLEMATCMLNKKVLFVDQQRVETEDQDKSAFLCDRLGRRYVSKADQGLDYLAVLCALSLCRSVYANRYSGAIYLCRALAPRFSRTTPELKWLSSIDGIKRAVELNPVFGFDIDRIIALIEPRERLVLYGAGTNGTALAKKLQPVTNDILFCDQRGGEIPVINGYKVVTPEKLSSTYQGERVIITPYHGRSRIRETLVEIGVPEDKIID